MKSTNKAITILVAFCMIFILYVGAKKYKSNMDLESKRKGILEIAIMSCMRARRLIIEGKKEEADVYLREQAIFLGDQSDSFDFTHDEINDLKIRIDVYLNSTSGPK